MKKKIFMPELNQVCSKATYSEFGRSGSTLHCSVKVLALQKLIVTPDDCTVRMLSSRFVESTQGR